MVVLRRPCSLRASSWALAMGMKRTFLTGLPRRPRGTSRRSWPKALMPTASQKPKGYGIGMEHQEADLAAGSGGACHGRGRRGTPRPRPTGAETARTAHAARPDPCRLWRRGHAGRVTPLLWHSPPLTRELSSALVQTAGWLSKAGGYSLTTWGSKPRDAGQQLPLTPQKAARRASPGSPLGKG